MYGWSESSADEPDSEQNPRGNDRYTATVPIYQETG